MAQVKSNSSRELKETTERLAGNKRGYIEVLLIISVFLVIASLLLIMAGLSLLAGCFMIVSAALSIIVIRKKTDINHEFLRSLEERTIISEKKDDVITNFSHRIREPLNNIVIIADMLMESSMQKKQKELIETIIASTSNMVDSVNELTMQSAENLSFVQRKAIKYNLLSTVQNTIALYNLKDNANLEFNLKWSENDDYDCLGDPIIIKQIILDLFSRIQSQVSENSMSVGMTINKASSEAQGKLISVILLADKDISIISDSGTDESLASRLISYAGGSYTQEKRADSSVLKIILPFTDPVEDPKQRIAPSIIGELAQKEKTRKNMKDLNVLLVEDNAINQKIIQLTLKPLVRYIDTAANGKEALQKFGTSKYDVILMDIQMPVMSGLVATEKIRALESATDSHVPIIAITANAMLGDQEKCLSAGIDDYISKPFNPSTLVEIIKKNL
jgi:CheY-like chemotaxis protein